MKRYLTHLLLVLVLISCSKDDNENNVEFLTENVIILVIDGPRYSETWGSPGLTSIPFQSSLKSLGVFYHNFYNEGVTSTVPGHTAITTGVYQSINNNGAESPYMPSIFQRWLKETGNPSTNAWVIASKDKLAVLANCTNLSWQNSYTPNTYCGQGGQGVGSGYQHDSLTLNATLSILNYHHPKMVLINFREPDYSGHTGDWNAYLDGITLTDGYVEKLWDFIQNDPTYKGKTALFITNDHGRHLDGVSTGFSGHGDDCEGCRHISLLALGPDFNTGKEVYTHHEMRDISITIAQLMKFPMENYEGQILTGLFNK